MAKATITAHDDRHVSLAYDDLLSGERIKLEIWAPVPREGGSSYIHYNGDKQLCHGLSGSGNTMTYPAGARLVDIVRREYRAMRRADKREANRRGY